MLPGAVVPGGMPPETVLPETVLGDGLVGDGLGAGAVTVLGRLTWQLGLGPPSGKASASPSAMYRALLS